MRTLNFTSGWRWKKIIPASLLLVTLMFMLNRQSLAQQFEPLDMEMLEFLGLYEAGEEDLLDIAMDEENKTPKSTRRNEAVQKQAGGE